MSKLRAALNLKAAKNKWGTILGWAMFDWANSAYALVIAVAIFPSYFLEIASDSLNVFGLQMTDSTLFAWSISFSYLVVAVLSPLLSGIADYGGKRKRFMGFFTTIGGLACISLVLFTNMQTLWIGVAGFILATIGFAGGIVFNNSYLPIITTEDKYDWASAIGFALGFNKLLNFFRRLPEARPCLGLLGGSFGCVALFLECALQSSGVLISLYV